jgi:histidinol-phosphate aminotransferase
VRMPGVSPLNRCIRITAGLPEELQILAETLPQSLEEVRKSF